MVWNNDDLVICLPETNHDEVMKLAQNIYNQLRIRLKIGPMMGIATFPGDGLIYQDLLSAALQNLVDFGGDSPAADSSAIAATSLFMSPTDTTPVKKTNPKKPKRGFGRKLAFAALRSDLEFLFMPKPRTTVQAEPVETPKDGDLRDPDFWIHGHAYQSLSARLLYRYIKRLMDLVLVILIMPLALPILVIIAIAIKLDDGGNIFYFQERTGLGGHRFKMYKFRSMIMNAPTLPPQTVVDPDGKVRYIWPDKLDRDPRVTRVGRILRKTSLDELPQLINVLKGDMSLVGPRPTSWDLDKYTLLQTERLTVRPGITGLWQVSARESKNPDERLLWDTAYIDKVSLRLDIQIMWRTVAQIYQKRGV
jgi:lipopolysaccharide/colanic/teichoic acid biosynthesis glycosyltransferase